MPLTVRAALLCSMPSAAQFTYFAAFMGAGIFFLFVAITVFLPVIILVCNVMLKCPESTVANSVTSETTQCGMPCTPAGTSKVCVGLHAGVGAHDGQLLCPQGLPDTAEVHDGEGAPGVQHRCASLILSTIFRYPHNIAWDLSGTAKLLSGSLVQPHTASPVQGILAAWAQRCTQR